MNIDEILGLDSKAYDRFMKPDIQYPVNPHYNTITQYFLTVVEFIKWYNENKNNGK